MKEKWYIGCFNKSVILTYIGVISALVGITNIVKYNKLKICMICLIISGICDLFDGTIARRCSRTDTEKCFGIQLDSLADIICFGAYPAIINIYLNKNAVGTIISVLYIISCINRLAWFNVHSDYKEFRGVPVTYSSLIIATAYVFSIIYKRGIIKVLVLISAAVLSILFSANIKISKPNKVTYIIMGMLAVAYTIIIIAYGY